MKRIQFLLVLILCWVSSYAYDFQEKNSEGVIICYSYIKGGTELEVKPYNPGGIKNYYYGSVVIPEQVMHNNKTLKVTKIGIGAFEKCSNLTSVTIPNSVTTIGKGAFLGSSAMHTITIGTGVTNIEKWAFVGCEALTSVYISDLTSWCKIAFEEGKSNPLCYANNLFLNKQKIKDLVIPDNITTIREYSFYNCSCLTSVTISNSVTSIERSAFSGCSGLTSVTIDNGVKRIGNGAFEGCSSLPSITIPNSVTSIGECAFTHCSKLTTVIIGNGVTKIEIFAFAFCSSLTSITIPNNVTTIEYCAFEGCSGLTSVTIGNGVTSIEFETFAGCNSLTSITIPNNVKSIGYSAFYNCSNLTSIKIPNSVTSIGGNAFFGCNSCAISEIISEIEAPFNIDNNVFTYSSYCNATLYVPKGTIDKYKTVEGWNKFVNIVEGSPSSVTNIKNEGVNEIKRYTLDGRVITDSHKGINIIQMKNGTTKKVSSK